jgi:hypothetical protein
MVSKLQLLASLSFSENINKHIFLKLKALSRKLPLVGWGVEEE